MKVKEQKEREREREYANNIKNLILEITIKGRRGRGGGEGKEYFNACVQILLLLCYYMVYMNDPTILSY